MATPDFDSAFRVRTLSLGGRVGVFAGEEDPRTLDTTSFPVGSVYFRTDGTTWKRTPSAWVRECRHHATGPGCPWVPVIRAIQAISTEVAVLRLIQSQPMERHCEGACSWFPVVKAIQAISTEVAVLRLIQSLSMETRCEHQ